MLPNLIVIGAPKSGTTSLHVYLGLHPEVSMSRPKELNFFVEDMYWGRGVGWYERHFAEDTPVRGESSVAYTQFPHRPGVPERMAAVVPGAKLLYLVRDPIERIVSSYAFNTWLGFRPRPFAEEVRDADSLIVAESSYWLQLERYLEHFAADRILVLDHDDLLHRRDRALRRVFRFLGVDETFSSPGFEQIYNRTPETRSRIMGAATHYLYPHLGGRRMRQIQRRLGPVVGLVPLHARVARPVVSDDLHRELAGRLAGDVARLRAFTGQAFASWSV